MHIDDWLDTFVPETPGEKMAMLWFEHFRRPAIEKPHALLARIPLFCTNRLDGKRYRVVGCSRLGDIWLVTDFARDLQKDWSYDKRVDIAYCHEWDYDFERRTNDIGPRDPNCKAHDEIHLYTCICVDRRKTP